MEHMSKRRSSRDKEQTASENYHADPRAKAMAVCIDWAKTTPTVLNSLTVAIRAVEVSAQTSAEGTHERDVPTAACASPKDRSVW
jgi:hypothetical protein